MPWIPNVHPVKHDAKVVHVGPDPLFSKYAMKSFRCYSTITSNSVIILEEIERMLENRGDQSSIKRRSKEIKVCRAIAESKKKKKRKFHREYFETPNTDQNR